MKSLGIQALILCFVSITLSASGQSSQKEPENINIPIYTSFSELAPIFQQQTDTTYVINFWATWCKPCVEELPYFEQLHEKYNKNKVKVILVSLDFPNQIESKLYPFVEANQLKSEVLAFANTKYNSWIDKVDPQWGGAIPITIIYKGDKRKFIGEQFADFEELDQFVQSFL